MDLANIEKVMTAVQSKLDAMDEASKAMLTEQQVKNIVQAHFDEALKDPDLARKMRFPGAEAITPALVGTKYARWGLTPADVEFLYDLQTAMKGKPLADGSVHPGPTEALENTFKAISEAVYIDQATIRKIDRDAMDQLYPRVPKHLLGQWDAQLKAMDTAESGFGQQLVGAQYVGELWEVARRESRLYGLLPSFEMTAPTAYLPVEVDFPELLFVSENTANNSSEYTTVKTGSQRVQVDAKKFVMHQMWSGEMEEDSIIPFVPFLRMQAAKGLAHYMDSLVLNGDTTNSATGNINLDDADPADTKHYLAFDGIRHAAIVDNTSNRADANGPVTFNLLRRQLGLMVDTTRFVDWGHPADPNDVIYVADIDTADRIAELDEVLTMDKYGPQATVFTGEVVKVGRHPLIVSMAMSKTEADGKVSNTAGNNTLGQVATFNRKGFVTGTRRRIKVEVERLPARDQTRLVYSLRGGLGRFTPTGNVSGIESAAVLYNINVS